MLLSNFSEISYNEFRLFFRFPCFNRTQNGPAIHTIHTSNIEIFWKLSFFISQFFIFFFTDFRNKCKIVTKIFRYSFFLFKNIKCSQKVTIEECSYRPIVLLLSFAFCRTLLPFVCNLTSLILAAIKKALQTGVTMAVLPECLANKNALW